jgi:hypothetical protein
MIDSGMSGLAGEMERLNGLIEEALVELGKAARAVAHAEHAYRRAKAEAWHTSDAALAGQRAAQVEAGTADLRLTRDLAAGAKQTAAQSVTARVAQLDALRSLVSAMRTEMGLAR